MVFEQPKYGPNVSHSVTNTHPTHITLPVALLNGSTTTLLGDALLLCGNSATPVKLKKEKKIGATRTVYGRKPCSPIQGYISIHSRMLLKYNTTPT